MYNNIILYNIIIYYILLYINICYLYIYIVYSIYKQYIFVIYNYILYNIIYYKIIKYLKKKSWPWVSCWLTEITTELISASRGTEKSNIFHLEASWPWGTNPRAPSFELNTQLAGSALSPKQGPRDWPLTWLSAHSSKPALPPPPPPPKSPSW